MPARDVFGNEITSATHGLIYYLRTNVNHEGATVVGTAYEQGWQFTISAGTSAGFDAGLWFWQAVAANVGGEKETLGAGQLTVEPALVYAGQPHPFDGRSQARKDLEQVEAAIRSLMAGGGVQEYTIGGRRLKRFDLADLIVLRDRLRADVVRAERAEKVANGLGDPHKVHIRFRG